MQAWVSNLKAWIGFSRRSTQRRKAAWALACPSVARSSKVIKAAFGRNPTMVRARLFPFPFLFGQTALRLIVEIALLRRLLEPRRSTPLGVLDGHTFTRVGRR